MFQKRAFCSCGWSVRAPFGDAFHASCFYEVCPECGKENVKDMPVLVVEWGDHRGVMWVDKLLHPRTNYGRWWTATWIPISSKRGSKINENSN